MTAPKPSAIEIADTALVWIVANVWPRMRSHQVAKEALERIAALRSQQEPEAGELQCVTCGKPESAAPTEAEGALSWALDQGDALAAWCNTAGAALRGMMDAYERRVRSLCSPAEIERKPWECAEFIIAREALQAKPVPTVTIPIQQAPSGEVAEAVHQYRYVIHSDNPGGWIDGSLTAKNFQAAGANSWVIETRTLYAAPVVPARAQEDGFKAGWEASMAVGGLGPVGCPAYTAAIAARTQGAK